MTVRYGSQPFQEAIRFFRQKLNVSTEHWNEVWTNTHNHAFMVAGAMKTDLLADLRQAVDHAIASGTSLGQFQGDFSAIVAKHGWSHTGNANWRSQIIYQTNLRQAYNAGREQQMQALKGRRPYGLYKHGDSQNPRIMHLKWNNLVLPLDHPWWQTHTPQNGWGCHCKKFSLSEQDLKRLGLQVSQVPDDGSFEWMDKITGEQHQIPRGIDPGFHYRPLPPKQRVQQAKQQIASKPPLAERLTPRMVPSAFSTAKGVNAQGLDQLLRQLPEQAQSQLQDFLQAHPVKTLFIKQSEMGKGKAAINLAPKVAEYLEVNQYGARRYFTTRNARQTGGFTSVGFDHVVVKVKADSKLSKAEVNQAQTAAAKVLHDAQNNAGPMAYRLPNSDNLKRHWTFSGAVEQQANPHTALLSTWLHELGHQVHYYANAPDIPVQPEQLITAYGSTSKHEFFAEGFAALMLNRATLEQWQPELVSWFDKHITTATNSSTKRR
ncbi:phage minor head protein [Agarivorans sp. QJM3NY_25]|uniref:phage minor head protein n=1 Tax=Agarivorans sp. QJM3NY_25 TaxID=3421430 RepID=UPI003D7D75DE